MKSARFFLFLLLGSIPLAAGAAVTGGDLPDGTVWYLHADLGQMRSTESGSAIYEWLDDEVIVEINEDLGTSFDNEIDSITAYSDESHGTVVVLDGPFSSETRDQLLRKIKEEVEVEDFDFEGKTYYLAGDEDEESGERRHDRDSFDDFEDAIYFSFDVRDKLIVSSNEDQMKSLLESGGKIAGSGSVDGAMFVLTADKSFVQAGLKPDGMADDDDDDWDSNIIRNTEQAVLLISDSNGLIAIEAQLVSTDPKMAQSIGGIVNGLISLQVFNSDLDPELQSMLQNTRVSVTDNTLSISTVIDPELVVSILID